MRFFLLFFLILPVLEITLLINIGGEIGVFATLGWLLLMVIAGITLLRVQGAATLMQARQLMAAGQAPTKALAKGVFVSVAAILLILPGFLTDLVGFLLLLPPLQRLLVNRWTKNARTSGHFYQSSSSGNIYESESFVVEEEKDVTRQSEQVYLPRDPEDHEKDDKSL